LGDNKVYRIQDWREIEPELQDDGEQIGKVAEINIDDRKIIASPTEKSAKTTMNTMTRGIQGKTKAPSRLKARASTPISRIHVNRVALVRESGKTMRGKYTF